MGELGASTAAEVVQDSLHRGCQEVLEIPVVAMCPATGLELGRFHRFVRPSSWLDDGVNNTASAEMRQQYSERCFNRASSAVPFDQALENLLHWIGHILGQPPEKVQQD